MFNQNGKYKNNFKIFYSLQVKKIKFLVGWIPWIEIYQISSFSILNYSSDY